MNSYRDQAQKLYDQMTPGRTTYQRMGMALRGAMAATVEEIEAHLVMVAEVGAEIGVTLYADKVEFGSSREQVAELAQAKLRQQKRSAGARALSAKYGKDAAEQIIANKTGKHVTLRR